MIVNGWFKLINKIQEVSWHIIAVSLTSLEWNVSVFFCYSGNFSFVFAALSDVWGGARCLFCPLCRNVTAGGCGHIFGFTATSSKCFNRQGKENKLAKTQRSASLNIMTKNSKHFNKSNEVKHGVHRAGGWIVASEGWTIDLSEGIHYWRTLLWLICILGVVIGGLIELDEGENWDEIKTWTDSRAGMLVA